ncbi:MAG: lipid-A-disaccharide synthase, partial [Bacteroidales bacterium]|nr:lipid-A-disaccharide synthase [Bacteroidales bacterium]
MKYYIIAGEASGDLHGANLVRALVSQDPAAEIRFWGGDAMREAGNGRAVLVKHYRELAYMGFWEVLTHLRVILGNMAFCRKDVAVFRPDAVILIDYPGFNLRIAKRLFRQGYRIYYYIAPQIWAWHTSRVKQIRRYIRRVYPVLPFEPAFYAKHGVEATFLGHPLLDAMARYHFADPRLEMPEQNDKPLVTLMPGSRKQEIVKIFPLMLAATRHFPEYRFAVAATRHLDDRLYARYMKDYPHIPLVYDRAYDLLSVSSAALVKSGTSTLETALLGIPEVVCYRASEVSYRIARLLVMNRIRFISLVNLIMDREVVKELLQHDLTEGNIVAELGKLLKNPKIREKQLFDYEELRDRLGQEGA